MTFRIDVVGLGPAGPGLLTAESAELLRRAAAVIVRTRHHPAADVVPLAPTFDRLYEEGQSLDAVYRSMADEVVAEAKRSGSVAYAVPGSPSVAESSVARLVGHDAVLAGEVVLRVHPAVSFVDLACTRLGVDPVASGMRLVDGESFAVEAAGGARPPARGAVLEHACAVGHQAVRGFGRSSTGHGPLAPRVG